MHPAKEYLMRIQLLEQRIKMLDEEIDKNCYLLLPSGIRYDAEKIQTSNRRLMEDAIVKVNEILERQMKDKVKLVAIRDRIIRQIGRIPDNLQADILHSHYVDGIPLILYAKKKYLSYDYVVHQHGAALNAFARKILKRNAQ